MKKSEFEKKIKALNRTGRVVEAARLVLCSGLSQSEAARRIGVAQPIVSRLCGEILNAKICRACGNLK